MPSSTAECIHEEPKRIPLLTAGEISPLVMRQWEMACEDYFSASKKLEEKDRVAAVLLGLKDLRARDWVATRREDLVALTFDDFMALLRSEFLPESWEDELHAKICSSRLKPADSFMTWLNELRHLNIILRGTDYHFTEDPLRLQLDSLIDTDLRTRAKNRKIKDVIDAATDAKGVKTPEARLNAWISEMRKLAEERANDTKHYKEAAENFHRSTKREQTDDFGRAAKRPALSQPSRFGNASTSASQNYNRTRPPKLTETERSLLDKHQGCTKCRRGYQNHRATNCPNGFPDPAGYKELTEEILLAHKRTKSVPASAKPVGAVVDSIESDEENAVFTVNAVMPSSVLDAGDTTDEEVCAPLTSRHYRWACKLSGPNTEFPVTVNSMIDIGAHGVFIDPSLVERLGLPRYKLHEPCHVDLALQNGKKTSTSLYEYVKIRPSSSDASWTSITLKAIIAPGLCVPILLGIPFLESNYIVIDCSLRTVIDKRCNYNLLDPEPVTARVPPPSPKERRRARTEEKKWNLKEKKVMFLELIDTVRTRLKESGRKRSEPVKKPNVAALIRERVKELAERQRIAEELSTCEKEARAKFAPVFEPIPHVDHLPTDTFARIKLKDASRSISSRSYSCPRKYRAAWQTLIDQHLEAGRIRPSSSSHASAAFIVPKSDPSVLPRWVNDYRELNDNTVLDAHPLPRIDDILADCAKGKIWAKIDMTNSFFQTRVHPDDIHLTAVNTPFGLYEWVVMPMGLKNSPAIHQRRVTNALRKWIGKICHVYLDDIVIWSKSIEEHRRNVDIILNALKQNHLYCNPKKSTLFCTELDFLGHHISSRGVEADSSKSGRIIAWPVPKSATEVRRFCGLVRYISSFLPNVTTHTRVLQELTTKDCDKHFPEWTARHQDAFDSIKRLVTSRECLTTIDFDLMDTHKIFVTMDASDYQSGAVLSFGETWETSRPVSFDSKTFKGAELNYPVHEKELLAIIRALKKWRSDLLGVPFIVYTDHRTLENFDKQKHLSRRQARWMEFLSQYEFKITYIPGEQNSCADALSRTEFPSADVPLAPILSIAADENLLTRIKQGYKEDPWCKKLIEASPRPHGITILDDLLYVGNRLAIPRVNDIRELLFNLAHDTLGHFGFDKSYGSLRTSFYWPKMRHDLQNAYVKGCADCQRNKSITTLPSGPLHPLPIPDQRGDSVAIDFIGPLPPDDGYDTIITLTDRLGSDIRLVPSKASLTAEELAVVFFDEWYCENGLPLEIVSDRDKLFTSKFWKCLHEITGVKLKMSTAFHPQTDGASERTNKTLNQCIRFHVDRAQQGWKRALPRIRFNLMNTINSSTGFSPFQLRMGRSPRVIPPLVSTSPDNVEDIRALEVIKRLEMDVSEAQDNLMTAKLSQTVYANKSRTDDFPLKIGDRVLLSTMHRRHEYKRKGTVRTAKFMPRFDGPYVITKVNHEHSTVTVDLPNNTRVFPTFHMSQIIPFVENNNDLFPNRQLEQPPPITIDDEEEYFIDRILDERTRGCGKQYLVRWTGYGPEDDRWLPTSALNDCEALDIWLARQDLSK
jgi:hypothetical protein